MKTKFNCRGCRWIAAALSFVLVLTGVCIGVVFAMGSTPSLDSVTVNYTAGKYLPDGESVWANTGLFGVDAQNNETVYTEENVATTVSGSLILQGDSFGDVVENENWTLTKTGEAKLDGETFYFDTPDTAAGEEYSDLWAYTFTGWHIKSAVDAEGKAVKIPGQTVFQPGDVIMPEILKEYAADGVLELEAVWGKCYFIRNPYSDMQYAATKNVYKIDKNGERTDYQLFELQIPQNVTPLSSDVNKGNDPQNPKATIDSLYAYMRSELGENYTQQRAHALLNDAYSRVVMLVGDLDYYTDSNQPEAKWYGYANGYKESGESIPNPSATTVVPVAATYKSLGDEIYTYNYKPRNYSNTLYGNIRFDSINFCSKKEKWGADANGKGGQDNGTEFQISENSGIVPADSYMEFTARYNSNMPTGRGAAITTYRPSDATYIVVNGGSFTGMQNQYSSGVTSGKQLYWVIGRKAKISNLNCGTTTSYSTSYQNVYYNYNVYVLGGEISNFYGGSNGLNTISAGKRQFFLYGNGSSADDYSYNPKIDNFYGGSSEARLFGDIYIYADGCTKLGNIYGGGRDYSATTYGNIKIELKNCTLSGDVYGGGKYGNCELTPSTYIQYADDPDTKEKIEKGTETELSVLDSNFKNNINIDGKNLVARNIAKIGGDVYIDLIDTDVKGNVFGSGMGQSQILEVRNQMQANSNEWWLDSQLPGDNGEIDNAEENAIPSDDKTWKSPIQGYPSYSEDGDNRVFVNAWRDGTYTTNARDIISFYNYHAYASLSLATVQNTTITIRQNSVIGTANNSLKGNVYGGGSIAKVLGDTSITITDSIVYGDIYGGGDGVTIPDKVKVYWPEDNDIYKPGGELYDAGVPAYASPYYTGKIGSITWNKQSPDPASRKNDNATNVGKYKKYKLYTWSSDAALLTGDTPGIDHQSLLIYSPNTDGLGSVEGNTNVTVNGNTTVYKNVYGGGNQGLVYGDTTVNIQDSAAVNNAVGNYGKVFGGGNGDAEKNQTAVLGAVYGDTFLNISGGTVLEAYGGCNAADVAERSESDKALVGENAYSTDGGNSTLNIYGGSVAYAFGGNNLKGVIGGASTAKITDGRVTSQLFGGGNEANQTGISNLIIEGGLVGTLDSQGNLDEANDKKAIAYGGGKAAKVGYTNVVMTGGKVRSLFGGSLAADIIGIQDTTANKTKAVSVSITGGTIVTFLGGNDQSGSIGGDIDITVGSNGDTDNNVQITNFFGGGNSANYEYGTGWSPNVEAKDYDDTPDETFKGVTVNILSGDIYQAFGGGVLANITNARMYVSGGEFNFIYGGGYQGDAVYTVIHMFGGKADGKMMPAGIQGDPDFNEQYGGYVYGGGYQGYVMSASVHIEEKAGKELKIGHSVFGGGNKADVGETNVVMKKGQIIGSVYGGGFEGKAGVDPSTRTFGSAYGTHVVLSGGQVGCVAQTGEGGREYFGSVYGGGYLGETYQTHIDISEVNHYGDAQTFELGGNVYGGGHNADVKADTFVHFLTGTIQKNIYGGGRNGNVGGAAHIDFLSGNLHGSVYAGGFMGTVGETRLLVTDNLETINQTVPSLIESIKKVFREETDAKLQEHLRINIDGSVFGGGEGADATVFSETKVVINMNCDFSASEAAVTTGEISSGETKTTVTFTPGVEYSKIKGNVYGGGDLGRVGQGTINPSNNIANVTNPGNTSVILTNGIINGAVFGGGSGVPAQNSTYELMHGVVFGKTNVTVNGGYVQGNIYGGGTQSRVYAANNDPLASSVNISETDGAKIAIGGSVFGGGDRGSSGNNLNASVPTTVGDVEVNIIGLPNRAGSSAIYFLGPTEPGETDEDKRIKGGGVYGDGNLCLVKGYRSINIQDFNMGEGSGLLKTFYSLQRADEATLTRSAVVLLGAVDLVDEEDASTYSINRIGKLSMVGGSTFKLDSIVKLLGELRSDVDTDRQFIKKGNNGQNSYTASDPSNPLGKPLVGSYADEAAEIAAYRAGTSVQNKNTVCVANGLFLEVMKNQNEYGPVYGLFTLELLYANPGEGGGFVYADIATSSGDFICETEKGYVYNAVTSPTEADFNAGKYFERVTGAGYVAALPPYNASKLYYTHELTVGQYMDVVDNVGGYIESKDLYTYYYWYIRGPIITYTGDITGHIGSKETSFGYDYTIPEHGDGLNYTLVGINVNDIMYNALCGESPLYQLVQPQLTESNEDDPCAIVPLDGQQIAVQVTHGDKSLGFLTYDAQNNAWGIKLTNGNVIYGYEGRTNEALGNTLDLFNVTSKNNKLSFILHKSTEVNAELTDMKVTVDIDLFDEGGHIYSGGVSTLIFNTRISIVRLVPEQKIFTEFSKKYAGIAISNPSSVRITGKSSFTVEYHTLYIPNVFPKIDNSDMSWLLSAEGYKYYMDTAGHFVTVHTDAQGAESVVNHTENMIFVGTVLTHDEAVEQNIYILNNEYYCKYSVNNETVVSVLDEVEGLGSDGSIFPQNTTITMVDRTGDIPTYYYYLVSSQNQTQINLLDFCVMGTNTPIREMQTPPEFISIYNDGGTSRITEDLVFIFDFLNVDWDTVGHNFVTGAGITLKHIYDSDDIMDYVKVTRDGENERVDRVSPVKTEFAVNKSASGIDGDWISDSRFVQNAYYDKDTASLKFVFNKDTSTDKWVNTLIEDGEFSLKIEMVDIFGTTLEMPVGIKFRYNNEVYSAKGGSDYAVIPLVNFGEHSIEIENLDYSLYNTYGENAERALFRMTVYSAPDANYYDSYETVIGSVWEYRIVASPTYSISVGTDGGQNQILLQGEKIALVINCQTDDREATANEVKFSVQKKSGEEYTDYALFDGQLGVIAVQPSSNAVEWQVRSDAPAGTYRLRFEYGDRIEVLYLVVRSE